MRRYFFVGFAVGVPAGMLVADLLAARSRRQWEARAREWIEVGRERASQMADHAVRAAQERIHLGAALNQVTREELLAVYGIDPVIADRILQGRPYRSDDEVVARGLVSPATF